MISNPGRHILDGTIRVLLAEALLPVTGVITVAFLTRWLGPDRYGLLVLTATLVSWIEWSLNSLFARATIKLVSNAQDWRPVGSALARLHLVGGIVAMLLLWLLAVPIARLFNEPALTLYLCLFALDIPLFALAQTHRSLLVGTGAFGQTALASAGRWITRLLLIVVLVMLGLSVPGAILGSIGASTAELIILRRSIRPALAFRFPLSVPSLWGYALPLFLTSMCLNWYNRLDLFALKILGATAAQAGIYGAVQNLSLLPGIFAVSFSPLLLSTLSRQLSNGETELAREMGRHALRVVLGLLPVAAMLAGAAPEIIGLLFGADFKSAAPWLAVLLFGSVFLVMLSVSNTILTAAGRPGWTIALTAPLVPLAIIGHLLVIPRFGAMGASFVTTLLAGLGALIAVLVIYRLWSILPSIGTLTRSALVSLLVYTVAGLWSTPGLLLFLKLPIIGVVILLGFLSLGEFTAEEIVFARSFFYRRPMAAEQPRKV